MKRLLAAVGVFVLVLAVSSALSAQSDPRIGTWKLNVAKSEFAHAAIRVSETRTYTASGDSVTMNAEVVTSDGSKQVGGYTAKADGKPYPYTGQNSAGAETISIRRHKNKFTSQSKKGGKRLFTTTDSFSADGKEMTLTTNGVNANGQSINSIRVYDKQ